MPTRLRLTLLLLSSLILTILLTTAALSGVHTLLAGSTFMDSATSSGSRDLFIALVTLACSVSALLGVWHVSSCVVALRHARRRAASPSASHLPRWLAPAVRRAVGGTVVLSLSAAPAFAAQEAEGGADGDGAVTPIVAVQVLSTDEEVTDAAPSSASQAADDGSARQTKPSRPKGKPARSDNKKGSDSTNEKSETGKAEAKQEDSKQPGSGESSSSENDSGNGPWPGPNPGSDQPGPDSSGSGGPSPDSSTSPQPGSHEATAQPSEAGHSDSTPPSALLSDPTTPTDALASLQSISVQVLPPMDELEEPRQPLSEPEPTPPLSPTAARHSPAWPLLRYGRADTAAQQYVVQEGESLWSITEKLWGHGKHREIQEAEIAQAWPELYALNIDLIGVDPDSLSPGMTLTIPERWS